MNIKQLCVSMTPLATAIPLSLPSHLRYRCSSSFPLNYRRGCSVSARFQNAANPAGKHHRPNRQQQHRPPKPPNDKACRFGHVARIPETPVKQQFCEPVFDHMPTAKHCGNKQQGTQRSHNDPSILSMHVSSIAVGRAHES